MRQPTRLDALESDAPRKAPLAIAILPSVATLGNLLCGFLAVFLCLLEMRATYFVVPNQPQHPYLAEFFPSYVSVGAYLVVIAMIFDALDGRLARMARNTSEFGAQLDSIADIVSFGVAPGLLCLTLFIALAVPAEGDPFVSKMQWRVTMLGALVYVACAAIRLARYNAENVKEEAAQPRFTGLPTPGAAAALIALLLLHEDFRYSRFFAMGPEWARVLRWMVGPAALGIGILMVSRIPYVHMFNVYFRREHPPTHLVGVLLILALGWFSPPVPLVLGAYIYLVSGLAYSFRQRRAWLAEREAPPPADRGEVN